MWNQPSQTPIGIPRDEHRFSAPDGFGINEHPSRHIFYQRMQGLMTEEEYQIATAMQTAGDANWYRPIPIPTLSPSVEAYVQSRLAATREYEDGTSLALGEQMLSIRRAVHENKNRLLDLIHAKEKLWLIKQESLIDKLQRVIDLHLIPPFDLIERGHRVQALDALKRKNPQVKGGF